MAEKRSRREVLQEGVRLAGLTGIATALGGVAGRAQGATVWQIDPAACTHCGLCATACVLSPSAVKCVHAYALCGYCNLCFAVLRDKRTGDDQAVENARCPVDAISRRFIEDPYHEIHVDEQACIGCALCVKGCTQFGNGSMFLQIRHDRCTNCNECAVSKACPADAVIRVPASKPYIAKRPKA